MDLGTIKQKLNSISYERPQEFLDDMALVFDNCIKFNGEESSVGKMCRTVRDEYKRLYEQLGFDFYI